MLIYKSGIFVASREHSKHAYILCECYGIRKLALCNQINTISCSFVIMFERMSYPPTHVQCMSYTLTYIHYYTEEYPTPTSYPPPPTHTHTCIQWCGVGIEVSQAAVQLIEENARRNSVHPSRLRIANLAFGSASDLISRLYRR